MHSLISSETVITQNKQIMTRSQPFEMLYSLNCQNLCSDFQENLEFKFSWGISAMINRFTGKMKTNGKKSLTVINRQGNSVNVFLFYELNVINILNYSDSKSVLRTDYSGQSFNSIAQNYRRYNS